MTDQDYYQVLGIAIDASPAAVRAAYARLARFHHPDTVGHLPVRLREVQEAYRCLTDPVARAAHDRALAEHERRHILRQQTLQRRLYSFDRRHPRAAPRRWRLPWLAALGRLPIGLLHAIWHRNRST